MKRGGGEMKDYFGEYVKNIRKKKLLSQREVAQAAGFTQAFLSDIENGKKYPTIKSFIALMEALDLSEKDVIETCFKD